jgi:hypothetical protein
MASETGEGSVGGVGGLYLSFTSASLSYHLLKEKFGMCFMNFSFFIIMFWKIYKSEIAKVGVCLYSQARDTFCLQPTTSRR